MIIVVIGLLVILSISAITSFAESFVALGSKTMTPSVPTMKPVLEGGPPDVQYTLSLSCIILMGCGPGAAPGPCAPATRFCATTVITKASQKVFRLFVSDMPCSYGLHSGSTCWNIEKGRCLQFRKMR